ncbi:MAG: MoxR family ATPase [Cytophagales bacterium]|nr:MoxR family ATPase [Bernardetiaceae bacterium]MDW8206070.1 MoxR family ATPase [Cytophagales bacterium]
MENQDFFQPRIDFSILAQAVVNIRAEIAKLVVGQQEMVDLLITALLANGHVLIEGVPGVAKTLTAKVLSRIMNMSFSRIQFTPDLMPSDVLGTSVYNLKSGEFEFKAGPIFANVVLIDEINRAPAKTQSALFEVMEERQATIDGKLYMMPQPFFVLATQNPIDQEGTYQLPEAQLDRFLFKIIVGYPSHQEELTILKQLQSRHMQNDLSIIRPLLSKEQVAQYRQVSASVLAEPTLLEYIVNIVEQSRNDPAIYLGASPRASIAILNSAKAYAVLNGRDFITPEDIRTVAPHVLRHRIMLTAEKEMEGFTADQIVHQLIERVQVPR